MLCTQPLQTFAKHGGGAQADQAVSHGTNQGIGHQARAWVGPTALQPHAQGRNGGGLASVARYLQQQFGASAHGAVGQRQHIVIAVVEAYCGDGLARGLDALSDQLNLRDITAN